MLTEWTDPALDDLEIIRDCISSIGAVRGLTAPYAGYYEV